MTSSSPLSHLRVIDLTDLRGALAGRLLADLGADVIKVESPDGDPGRLVAPFVDGIEGPDRSIPFLYRNANKRGAVIDLWDAAGRQRFDALCRETDVLVENLGPDEQQRLDLTPEMMAQRHPHLIHVALADFGSWGPRASWRAEPLAAFAASGALYASGLSELPPCWLPGYTAHDCASVFAVAGVLAALLDRKDERRGQAIEISVQEAALRGLYPWAIPLADYSRLYPMLPASPPRNGDGNYMVLPAADGHVRMLAGTVRHWRAFVGLLGNPEALAGPEWENVVFRYLSADVVRLIASDILRERRRSDLFEEAQRIGMPLAPVNAPEEFVVTEQTRTRGYFRSTGFPHIGDAPFAPAPFNFSRTPVSLRRPAPTPGEDDAAGFHPRPEGSTATSGAAGPPLAGWRVINLGVGAVVPEVCWFLSELGAEVVKIESRANLDFLRGVTIEPDTPNRAWTFNTESRGQKSVCLDLRTAHGRDLALRLCATADIVAENNRGGVAKSWGLDYEDVRRVRPDVIYLASQGYGRSGPLGEIAAFGPLNGAFCGLNWLWNHPDAPYPVGSSLNHPDHIASQLGAVAVLAAIEHRRRSGEGQFIEMAQTEAAAFLLGEFYLQRPCAGVPARPQGNRAAYAVPHGIYPCAGEDRWCAIAVVGDAAWARFVGCLGWPFEPQLATLAGRRAAEAEIDERVAAWTRQRSAEKAAAMLQAAGISAMIALSPDDLRADSHLAERRSIVTLEHPEVGQERHAANPIRMSRTELVTAGPAPLLGADTEEVLTRLLGLTSAEVQRLVEQGVCC